MRAGRPALALAAMLALCANAAPTVTLDSGRIEGERLGPGAAFRGIPFAEPPVGERRWRDAVPVRAWQGLRPARSFGPACPQLRRRDGLEQSEDCLNLNVLTPDTKASGLPVLVVIHGGAYAFGSNRDIAEQGLTRLLRKGVVLVTPNYRIGRLGFFAHPGLTAEAGRGTGNFWLGDQILALDWVRRNIRRFGGDPARVTILGCSAGGSSVNALMASPAARGLFRAASAHSGGGLFNANRPLVQAEAQGLAFAARAGVAGTGAEALARLRALSPAQVLAADPGAPDFGAIVDGHLLTAPLAQAFARGDQAQVPYIAGSTSNEASVFGLMGFDGATMRERFGIDLEQLRPIYERRFGPIDDAALLRRVQTDFLFTSAALALGGFAARRAPAWTYHFAFVPPAERSASPGAPHCADMAYLFGPLPYADGESRQVANRMQDYWFNFIRSGQPGGHGLLPWPAMAARPHPTLVIDRKPAVVIGFGAQAMAVWFARWRAATNMETTP